MSDLVPPAFDSEIDFLLYLSDLLIDYENSRRGNAPPNGFDWWIYELRSETAEKLKEFTQEILTQKHDTQYPLSDVIGNI